MDLSSCIPGLFGRKLGWTCAVWLWPMVVIAVGLRAAEVRAWNTGWRFMLEAEPSAAEAGWREVRLPHDWSADFAPREDAAVAGHGGFAVTGTGWYEKRFATDPAWRGKRVELHFEGVYMDAEVWLNEVRLGGRRNGWLPWRVDLTGALNDEGDNVLRVRVNNGDQPNARWYTGSGIYRPVWLEVSDPVHIVPDSGVSTTGIRSDESVAVELGVEVENGSAQAASVLVDWRLRDADGTMVASARRAVRVAAGARATVPAAAVVEDPVWWSPDDPVLYTVEVELSVDGTVTDRRSWSTGLRTIEVSAERGFVLNGTPLKLYGGNVHADNGLLGAVVLPRAEERKVALMKAAGYNAVRTAHNPPSVAFLEACDRLGMLVVNELYDDWLRKKTKQAYGRFIAEEWSHDVATWVRRDRRHPSVVMWSIGNEMYERANASGREWAAKLAAAVRRHDGTRPVTAGVNGVGASQEWSVLDGLFASLDAAGYNYELAARHEADHARLPKRVMYASESYQQEAYLHWAIMQQAPWVIGDFVWSAIDYLGESGIGRVFPAGEEPRKHWEGSHWPWRGAYCGDIDLTGWRKPISHYRQIVWDRGERLFAAVEVPSPDGQPWQTTPWSLVPELPCWTWAGHEGEPLTVNVYSRWPRVRLRLNGEVVGEAVTGEAEAFRAQFGVPYVAGELVAAGLEADGTEKEMFVLRTSGEAAGLNVVVDRTTLAADGEDLAFVTIEAVDAAGVWRADDTRRVRVVVEGAGTLAALGTGDPAAPGSYLESERALWQGRALAIVRTTDEAGVIRLRVLADGLPERVVELASRRE